MRLGLIGDVHAEDERLRVVLAAFEQRKVDRILCVGDVADGQGHLDVTCRLLADHRVTVVRGAHDRWLRDDTVRDLPHAHRMTSLSPETVAFLKALPPTATLDVPGGKLLLCHGVGDDDSQELSTRHNGASLASNDALLKVLFDPSILIMVCGRTHEPMVRRLERGAGKRALVVVNPGTLARDEHPGFAILDIEGLRADFFQIGESLGVEPVSRGVL